MNPRTSAHREVFKAAIDVGAWAVSIMFVSWVVGGAGDVLPIIVAAGGLQIALGCCSGLYQRRWAYGSHAEVGALAIAVAGASAGTVAIAAILDRADTGAKVTVLGAALALVMMYGARWLHRQRHRIVHSAAGDRKRVLVIGAGWGGEQSVDAMLRDGDSPYWPVAILDDNPRMRHRRLTGVPVVGGIADLAETIVAYRVDVVVIAIAKATSELIRSVDGAAHAAGADVKVLPPVAELFSGAVSVQDIRSPTETDLLGRKEVAIDLQELASCVTGKRVLVTGAGGSIGSELCRQLWLLGVDQLLMLDRDESALHGVQLLLEQRALLDTRNLIVADIRDSARLHEVFAEHRPQIVFHTAALKHLSLLEMHPSEAIQTNVWGTAHVLDAAQRVQVERFVNISTDKAADPISVLGFSKRIGERLTAAMADRSTGTYLSVRFGNVLGSRGSVLPTFRAQVAAGGPLTVTDPDVTRFFMTVEEAVHLVIQAAAVGEPGEALVLDMGSPVRIADVARHFAAASSRPIEIKYTGLRPGEKLHEVLIGPDETEVRRPMHPLISHVEVPPLSRGALAPLTLLNEQTELVDRLRRIALSPSVVSVPSAVTEPWPPILLSPPHIGPVERSFLTNAVDSNWIAPWVPTWRRSRMSLRRESASTLRLRSSAAPLHSTSPSNSPASPMAMRCWCPH